MRGLLILAVLLSARPALGEDIAVVVNPLRPGSVGRAEVAQIYLKQRRFWGDRSGILPVNREAAATIRSSFEKALFGTRARRLSDYWNRQYFRGVLPPVTLASDEAIRRFVATEPRAIGYIRASAVDDTVRVVLVLQGSAP